MQKLLFLVFLSLWLALPVLGQTSLDGFTNCGTPASTARAETNLNIGAGRLLCFDFDSGFSTGTSSAFRVVSGAAKVCLDPDRGGTAGAAVVDIQVCPTSDTATDNTCVDTSLTVSAANPCESVARGRYRYEVTTAAAGTEDAQITAEGY